MSSGFGCRGTSNEVKATGPGQVINRHHIIPPFGPRLLYTIHLSVQTRVGFQTIAELSREQQLPPSILGQETQICHPWREWTANEPQMLFKEHQTRGFSLLLFTLGWCYLLFSLSQPSAHILHVILWDAFKMCCIFCPQWAGLCQSLGEKKCWETSRTILFLAS